MNNESRKNFTALQWLAKNYKSVYEEYKQHELNRKRERARMSIRKLREERKNNPVT